MHQQNPRLPTSECVRPRNKLNSAFIGKLFPHRESHDCQKGKKILTPRLDRERKESLRRTVSEKVDGVITKPVLEEISQNIKIIFGLEIGKILAKLVEDFRVFRAQMKVRD